MTRVNDRVKYRRDESEKARVATEERETRIQ